MSYICTERWGRRAEGQQLALVLVGAEVAELAGLPLPAAALALALARLGHGQCRCRSLALGDERALRRGSSSFRSNLYCWRSNESFLAKRAQFRLR